MGSHHAPYRKRAATRKHSRHPVASRRGPSSRHVPEDAPAPCPPSGGKVRRRGGGPGIPHRLREAVSRRFGRLLRRPALPEGPRRRAGNQRRTDYGGRGKRRGRPHRGYLPFGARPRRGQHRLPDAPLPHAGRPGDRFLAGQSRAGVEHAHQPVRLEVLSPRPRRRNATVLRRPCPRDQLRGAAPCLHLCRHRRTVLLRNA